MNKEVLTTFLVDNTDYHLIPNESISETANYLLTHFTITPKDVPVKGGEAQETYSVPVSGSSCICGNKINEWGYCSGCDHRKEKCTCSYLGNPTPPPIEPHKHKYHFIKEVMDGWTGNHTYKFACLCGSTQEVAAHNASVGIKK